MRLRGLLAARRGRFGTAALLVVVVWAGPGLLPEDLGLSFGIAYQLFFSAFTVAAVAFFELLRPASPSPPRGGRRALANVGLVYAVTVGSLVGVGQLYPQFEVPRLQPGQTELSPEERGKAIFWDGQVACFACHAIAGRGGKRAPDLAGIGVRAATRKPGVAADEYLREHIKLGSPYGGVPGYPPIMPPFAQRLTPAQIEDLVTFLAALR